MFPSVVIIFMIQFSTVYKTELTCNLFVLHGSQVGWQGQRFGNPTICLFKFRKQRNP